MMPKRLHNLIRRIGRVLRGLLPDPVAVPGSSTEQTAALLHVRDLIDDPPPMWSSSTTTKLVAPRINAAKYILSHNALPCPKLKRKRRRPTERLNNWFRPFAFWNNPAEDIYSRDDGEPYRVTFDAHTEPPRREDRV